MKPFQYYLDVIKKFAQFSGRARRSEYWYFVLFNWLISFGLGFVDKILGFTFESSGSFSSGYISSIYGLAIFIPSIAVAVRRLHDVGKSGLNIFWVLVPILGWIYLIYLYVSDSEYGDNRYGPNPKDDSTELKEFLND